jgi:hypothetical protein
LASIHFQPPFPERRAQKAEEAFSKQFEAKVIPFGGHADYFSAPGLTAYSLVEP